MWNKFLEICFIKVVSLTCDLSKRAKKPRVLILQWRLIFFFIFCFLWVSFQWRSRSNNFASRSLNRQTFGFRFVFRAIRSSVLYLSKWSFFYRSLGIRYGQVCPQKFILGMGRIEIFLYSDCTYSLPSIISFQANMLKLN